MPQNNVSGEGSSTAGDQSQQQQQLDGGGGSVVTRDSAPTFTVSRLSPQHVARTRSRMPDEGQTDALSRTSASTAVTHMTLGHDSGGSSRRYSLDPHQELKSARILREQDPDPGGDPLAPPGSEAPVGGSTPGARVYDSMAGTEVGRSGQGGFSDSGRARGPSSSSGVGSDAAAASGLANGKPPLFKSASKGRDMRVGSKPTSRSGTPEDELAWGLSERHDRALQQR